MIMQILNTSRLLDDYSSVDRWSVGKRRGFCLSWNWIHDYPARQCSPNGQMQTEIAHIFLPIAIVTANVLQARRECSSRHFSLQLKVNCSCMLACVLVYLFQESWRAFINMRNITKALKIIIESGSILLLIHIMINSLFFFARSCFFVLSFFPLDKINAITIIPRWVFFFSPCMAQLSRNM